MQENNLLVNTAMFPVEGEAGWSVWSVPDRMKTGLPHTNFNPISFTKPSKKIGLILFSVRLHWFKKYSYLEIFPSLVHKTLTPKNIPSHHLNRNMVSGASDNIITFTMIAAHQVALSVAASMICSVRKWAVQTSGPSLIGTPVCGFVEHWRRNFVFHISNRVFCCQCIIFFSCFLPMAPYFHFQYIS